MKVQKHHWKECYYYQIVSLAKSGLSNQQISDALGIELSTLYVWFHRRPAIKQEVDNVRSAWDVKESTFRNYVYGRLPERIRMIWERINQCEMARDGYSRIEGILAREGDTVKQHLFLYSLVHCNFNPSEACRKININKSILDKWISTDPEFAEVLDEINWHKGNFFEEALVKCIKDGVPSAIIFANKTFNKQRGYGEKIEIEATTKDESFIDLSSLDLSMETKKELLRAIQNSKKKVPMTIEHSSK